jgi:hypothetical protein
MGEVPAGRAQIRWAKLTVGDHCLCPYRGARRHNIVLSGSTSEKSRISQKGRARVNAREVEVCSDFVRRDCKLLCV